jgi:hypothetical protein
MSTEPVNVQSHHEVMKWTRGCISNRTFRRCAHLRVISIRQGGALSSSIEVFLPDCARKSFNWKFPPTDRQEEYHILVNMLHMDVINCPSDCVNFTARWWARVGRVFSELRTLPQILIEPFQWFARLPWQTQVAIIILLIVFLARPLVPLLLQILKAFHGQ